MMIRFIPSMKHYGKMALGMPNEELNITAASQLVECIRDGYIPIISWADTKPFLYEMAFRADENGIFPYSVCTGIIDAIANRYFAVADYMEGDAIITFHRFLKTGILEF